MRQPWLAIVTAFMLFTLVTEFTCALQLEFYSQRFYKGFIDGVTTEPGQDTGCFNLENLIQIKSVKTDKCVMLYETTDCSQWIYDRQYPSPGFNMRVKRDTALFMSVWAFTPYDNYRQVKSFHVCSQELGGGPALDINYYSANKYSSDIVREWRNVCTCQNVPESIRGGASHQISIRNFGNDMELFEKENCRGLSARITAGDNNQARFIFAQGHEWLFDVASFRPYGLLDCVKLNATIVEFRFTNGTTNDPIVEKVKLATTGQIINNGAADTTEQYTLAETVTETVTFTVATGYTELTSVGVSASVSIKTTAGVPLIGESDITASISANYKYDKGSSGTNTTTNTVTKTTTVQVVQTIRVPGCHNCIANAYVKQSKDFPIAYESYAQISGYAGSTRLNAAEIRANLPPGVSYVKDVDGYTVLTLTVGTMYAQYGLQTMIDVDCAKIPDCDPHVSPKLPTTFHYEIPFENTKQTWSSTQQNICEIGTSMGINGNWNGLSESSFAY